jgi:hydrogen peroxide-dependent heme synthase
MRTETGLGVLHLFCKPAADRSVDRAAVSAAIKAVEAAEGQVITAAMLGHKCDVAVMALHPDWSVLRALQGGLHAAGLDVVDSYVSITEVSEYAKGLPEQMLHDRLYPSLPPEGKPVFCFYPMTKRREAHANWYATPYEERDAMMREHGKSGRTFAGKVVQLITGSTGLDDFEWGVTLFATTPEVVKDVVYTMRFDKGSALYGEFGRFYVGYLAFVDDVLDGMGR